MGREVEAESTSTEGAAVLTVILDACCTLNLAATNRIHEILAQLPYRFCIGSRARGEAQWLRIPGEELREQVDLQPLIEREFLSVAELHGAEEEALFVVFTGHVADGEAEGAALAINRGCILATDDRKARRVVTADHPALRLTGTLELLREWQELTVQSDEALADALRRISERARYRPRRDHPLWQWWSALIAR